MNLEEISSEVNGDEPRAAAHSGEIEAPYIASHLVLVDHHCGERRSGGEEAAVHDEDVHVFGLNPSLLKERIERGENDHLGLGASSFHGGSRRNEVIRRRKASLLSQSRSLQNPYLKLHALRVQVTDQASVLHERGEGDSAGDRRLEEREVNKVNRPRSGQNIHRSYQN